MYEHILCPFCLMCVRVLNEILPDTMITYNQGMCIHMKQCHMAICMSLKQIEFNLQQKIKPIL